MRTFKESNPQQKQYNNQRSICDSRHTYKTRLSRTTRVSLSNNEPEQIDVSIYFDQQKKSTYMSKVINKYFELPITLPIFSVSAPVNNSSLKVTNLSRHKKAKQQQQIKFKRTSKFQSFSQNIQISNFTQKQKKKLPMISQDYLIRRPKSQNHRKTIRGYRESNEYSSERQSQSNISIILKQEQKTNSYYANTSNCQYKFNKKIKMRQFNSQQDECLQRQMAISKLGFKTLWRSINKCNLQYPIIKNLRQSYFTTLKQKRGDQPFFTIIPNQAYKLLFVNECQQLIDLVICICKTIINGKNRVANLQISLDNITKINQKDYRLYDWGCAAILQKTVINKEQYPKYYNPFCQINHKWILTPQYLAPQVLQGVQLNNYCNFWENNQIDRSDIWSLGCLLFQIITIIPLSIPFHSIIKDTSHSHRGLLYNKIRNPNNIINKQKYLKSVAVRKIKQAIWQRKMKINEKILNIIPKMLEFNNRKRISPQQIISDLYRI